MYTVQLKRKKGERYDNIRLPLEIVKRIYSKEDILSYAKKLGIEDILDKKCEKLSGGEKQRVAIARAIVNTPEYLLADEPTGNVDYVCKKEIMEILTSLNEQGQTIIMITHDLDLVRYASRVINLNEVMCAKGNE